MKKRIIAIATAAMILVSSPVLAHGGRTDKYGGHTNRKTGEYHYHNGGYSKPKPTTIYSKPKPTYTKPKSTYTKPKTTPGTSSTQTQLNPNNTAKNSEKELPLRLKKLCDTYSIPSNEIKNLYNNGKTEQELRNLIVYRSKLGFEDIMTVNYINIGQGDATLIQYGDYDVLIDAGAEYNSDTLLKFLSDHYVDDIELLITTHAHADHIGGADSVLDKYDVERIVTCDDLSNSNSYKDYKTAIANEMKDLKTSKYDNNEDRYFKIDYKGTSPLGSSTDESYIKIIGNTIAKDVNDSSTVVEVKFKNKKFLFTGDLEKNGELQLLNKMSDVDILQVGHHGSRTSTSKELLEKTKPEYAIISAGLANKYGHPHKETIDLLKNNNTKIYGTPKDGTITAITNGTTKLYIQHEKLMDIGYKFKY